MVRMSFDEFEQFMKDNNSNYKDIKDWDKHVKDTYQDYLDIEDERNKNRRTTLDDYSKESFVERHVDLVEFEDSLRMNEKAIEEFITKNRDEWNSFVWDKYNDYEADRIDYKYGESVPSYMNRIRNNPVNKIYKLVKKTNPDASDEDIDKAMKKAMNYDIEDDFHAVEIISDILKNNL